jgi:phosphopentomutase
VTGSLVAAGVDLGVRTSFADVGQTLAHAFGLAPLANGTSFLTQIASLTGAGRPVDA